MLWPEAGYTLRAFAPALAMKMNSPCSGEGRIAPLLAATVVNWLVCLVMTVAVPCVVPAALRPEPFAFQGVIERGTIRRHFQGEVVIPQQTEFCTRRPVGLKQEASLVPGSVLVQLNLKIAADMVKQDGLTRYRQLVRGICRGVYAQHGQVLE